PPLAFFPQRRTTVNFYSTLRASVQCRSDLFRPQLESLEGLLLLGDTLLGTMLVSSLLGPSLSALSQELETSPSANHRDGPAVSPRHVLGDVLAPRQADGAKATAALFTAPTSDHAVLRASPRVDSWELSATAATGQDADRTTGRLSGPIILGRTSVDDLAPAPKPVASVSGKGVPHPFSASTAAVPPGRPSSAPVPGSLPEARSDLAAAAGGKTGPGGKTDDFDFIA